MYSAYVLTDEARAKLLALFPPKFPEVLAKHITYRFGIPRNAGLPAPALVRVIGYADDESLEALVVEVDGSTSRPDDGSTFHITWSLDRTKGRRPADAKHVITFVGYKTHRAGGYRDGSADARVNQ